MNKGLEAITSPVSTELKNGKQYYTYTKEDVDTIEQELKNYYEGIKNAETYVPHPGKDALFDLEVLALKNVDKRYWKLPEQLAEDVRKELHTLEIIKEKRIDVDLFLRVAKFNNFELYNFEIGNGARNITQEEYNLLKEVFYGK